ncbi:hypothetical protein Trydic_g9106 [Trypoxylus dichotomus]
MARFKFPRLSPMTTAPSAPGAGTGTAVEGARGGGKGTAAGVRFSLSITGTEPGLSSQTSPWKIAVSAGSGSAAGAVDLVCASEVLSRFELGLVKDICVVYIVPRYLQINPNQTRTVAIFVIVGVIIK